MSHEGVDVFPLAQRVCDGDAGIEQSGRRESDLVISQVYGEGANAGATYANDYVELFNRGTTPASLNGLSIQYASATGSGAFGANSGQITELRMSP